MEDEQQEHSSALLASTQSASSSAAAFVGHWPQAAHAGSSSSSSSAAAASSSAAPTEQQQQDAVDAFCAQLGLDPLRPVLLNKVAGLWIAEWSAQVLRIHGWSVVGAVKAMREAGALTAKPLRVGLAPNTAPAAAAAAASSSPHHESDEIVRMQMILAQGHPAACTAMHHSLVLSSCVPRVSLSAVVFVLCVRCTGGVFCSFAWKNREDADDDSKPGPHGLSSKLWLKFRRRLFQLHQLLDAWTGFAKQTGKLTQAPRFRPKDWEALHTLAESDWPAFVGKLKLFLRTLPTGRRWSGSKHLCSWQGSGRTFRELFTLLKQLLSFSPYFEHLTLEDISQKPDAVFHFVAANVPSRVLALVFRTQQHAIPEIAGVTYFRERYASLERESAVEFQQRGILHWIVHEIDKSQLPRTDGLPAYTIELCKLHLQQAGLKPSKWPAGFEKDAEASFGPAHAHLRSQQLHDSACSPLLQLDRRLIPLSMFLSLMCVVSCAEFLDAVFVQLCADEGCLVEAIVDPPIGMAILKREAAKAQKAQKADAPASSSSVMADDQPMTSATPTPPPQAAASKTKAKNKRKSPAKQPAPSCFAPVQKKLNVTADRPPSLRVSIPVSPALSCSSAAATASPPALPTLASPVEHFPPFYMLTPLSPHSHASDDSSSSLPLSSSLHSRSYASFPSFSPSYSPPRCSPPPLLSRCLCSPALDDFAHSLLCPLRTNPGFLPSLPTIASDDHLTSGMH